MNNDNRVGILNKAVKFYEIWDFQK
jgi:hypothetical protein